MVKRYNYNSNINMVVVPVKQYTYCWKCGRGLPEGSTVPFCHDIDNFCMNEYYKELAQDMDDIISNAGRY